MDPCHSILVCVRIVTEFFSGTSGVKSLVQTTVCQIFILGSSFVTYLTNSTLA